MTGIDLNRAGTPLLEIVSEPDMRSADEAVAYAKTLHALVRWIGICDGNMQEGSFRCDANVSVRPAGSDTLGTRCEIKNLNSFRFLQQAIEFEVRRQIELIEDGGTVVQETRLYDPDRDETRSMRSKEDAQDYRYFPDPDLPPLAIDDAWIERVRDALPELPEAMQRALRRRVRADAVRSRRRSPASREIARLFRGHGAVDAAATAKLAANWIMGELAAALHRDEAEIDIARRRYRAGRARRDCSRRIADGTISGKIAKDVFDAMWAGEGDAGRDHRAPRPEADLRRRRDREDRRRRDRRATAIVAEYRAGKEKAFNSLVGKVMAATRARPIRRR